MNPQSFLKTLHFKVITSSIHSFGHATTAGCTGSSRVCWCLCGRRASKGCWFFVSDRYHGVFVQEKETIIEGYEWQHPGVRVNNNNTVFICFQKSVWGWASRFSQLDFFPQRINHWRCYGQWWSILAGLDIIRRMCSRKRFYNITQPISFCQRACTPLWNACRSGPLKWG